MPPEQTIYSIDATAVSCLLVFRRRSRTFGHSLSKVPFQTSTADSLVTPSLDRTLYGGSGAPKKPWVVCLLSHPYISACTGPELRSRSSLHLLLLVPGEQTASELRDAHTHACPVMVYPLTCRCPDQLGSRDPITSAKVLNSGSWVLQRRTYRCPRFAPTNNVLDFASQRAAVSRKSLM